MEGSHQFIVLMLQEVTVINVSRILDQLIFRSIEVRVVPFAIDKIVTGGPSGSDHHHSPVVQQGNFLPSSVLLRHVFVRDWTTYVLVLINAVSLRIVLQSFSLSGDLCKDIETNYR